MPKRRAAPTYGKIVDPCCPRMLHPVHNKIPAEQESAACPLVVYRLPARGHYLQGLQSACCTLDKAGKPEQRDSWPCL